MKINNRIFSCLNLSENNVTSDINLYSFLDTNIYFPIYNEIHLDLFFLMRNFFVEEDLI